MATGPAEGPVFGVYRAVLEDGRERPRRFRLLLFAELPDRLHAEVLSPVGSTAWIVDGGAGRISIAPVREGLAYVGPARAEAIESVLGIRLGLEELVRGILLGEIPRGTDGLTRVPAEGRGLPDRIEIRSAARRLSLELKRKRSVRGVASELGTGTPPDGLEARSLDELGELDFGFAADGEGR